tara:strand:+ start:2354 stop:2866 length:513 start_codon:yes stop_codon:yes gene_type:complete
MAIKREAILQRHIKNFCRDAITARHEFFAFDRAKAAGKFTHAAEKARGVRAGTPDTVLLMAGIRPIFCELKAPGKKASEIQGDIGQRLIFVDCYWSVKDSVWGYWSWLRDLCIPMRPDAEQVALLHDAQVAATVGAAEAKAGKPPKATKRKVEPRYVATAAWSKRNAGLI